MEKTKFYLTIPFVAVVTLALLAIPLVAMQFSSEVNWSVSDFILMGALIFGAGTVLVVMLRTAAHMAYRAGVVMAIGTSFLLVWANLAVGLIGSGPNTGNILYMGVLVVLMAGIYLSKFKPAGMERAMFASAFSVILVGVVALLMNMQQYPGSSVIEIIGVSMFFATPYFIAGLLFRFVALEQAAAH